MSIFTLDFLVSNNFKRRRYPDGWFWLLSVHDDLFLQVEESNNRASIYDHGWVEDMLTYDEVVSTIKQFKERQTQ